MIPITFDLFSFDYFFWYTMKSILYDTLVNSQMDLEVRTSIAVATIETTTGILKNFRQLVSDRCSLCIHAKGPNFDQHICCFMSYIIPFLCNKVFHYAFCIVALLYLRVSLSREDDISAHASFCNYGF